MPIRPKSAGERAEADMKDKAKRAQLAAKDPAEKLRYVDMYMDSGRRLMRPSSFPLVAATITYGSYMYPAVLL